MLCIMYYGARLRRSGVAQVRRDKSTESEVISDFLRNRSIYAAGVCDISGCGSMDSEVIFLEYRLA